MFSQWVFLFVFVFVVFLFVWVEDVVFDFVKEQFKVEQGDKCGDELFVEFICFCQVVEMGELQVLFDFGVYFYQ